MEKLVSSNLVLEFSCVSEEKVDEMSLFLLCMETIQSGYLLDGCIKHAHINTGDYYRTYQPICFQFIINIFS